MPVSKTPYINVSPFSGFTYLYNGTVLDLDAEAIFGAASWVTPDGATRSITHVCFATANVSTGGTLTCQIESIDSDTGLPDGIIAAGASGSQAVGAGDDWAIFEVALSTPYTLTSGTVLAITLMLSGSGNLTIGGNASFTSMGWAGTALGGASWSITGGGPSFWFKASTGEYVLPLNTSPSCGYYVNINTGSTPRYVGNKIVVAKDCRLCGFSGAIDPDYDVTVKLVDSNGNVLKADDASTDMAFTLDATYRLSSTTAYGLLYFFPKSKTLVAGTAYYLIFSPDTASNTTVRFNSYANHESLKTDLSLDTDWDIVAIASPSSWSITETSTRLYALLPVFDGIDYGASGGSSPRFGDMTGGLK